MNGETIDLIPLPLAHTDGDTAVKFRKNDVLMTGDVYRSVGFPNIDRASGGSLKGMLEAFDTLIAAAGPNTKVLPGHGPITNRAGMVPHQRMALALRDQVAKTRLPRARRRSRWSRRRSPTPTRSHRQRRRHRRPLRQPALSPSSRARRV